MPRTLEGKVAIVTGGARGIGRGIAAALLEQGCRVMIASRTESDLEAAEAGLRDLGEVWAQRCDVSAAADVDSLVSATESKYGPLDAMVCSTAWSPTPRLWR